MTPQRYDGGGGSLLSRLALAAGALVAAMVAAIGLLVAWNQPAQWSAEASLLVLPRASTDDPDVLAGLYDSLSRGQVAATYAELLRTGRFQRERGPQSRGARAENVEVIVEVVPETSVIRVTATAESPATAEQTADDLTGQGRVYLSGLPSPYDVEEVGRAAGTAQRAGPGRLLLTAVVAMLAVIAGVAAHQVVRQLGALARRGRSEAAAPAPPAHVSPAATATSPRSVTEEPPTGVAPDRVSSGDTMFEPDGVPAVTNGRWRLRLGRRETSR